MASIKDMMRSAAMAVAPEAVMRRERARAMAEYYRGVRKAAKSADYFRGGSKGRLDSKWQNEEFRAKSIRGLRRTQLKDMRSRARHLERNNFLASAILGASTNFVIGKGSEIQPSTKDAEFNKRAAELWQKYWVSPEVTGLMTGQEIERNLWRAHMRDGDVGAVLLKSGRIQVIEGDQVNTPTGLSSDANITDGVRTNSVGRPVSFYVEQDDGTGRQTNYTPVSAENFIWLPRLVKFKEVRGWSAFTSNFFLYDQISGLIEGAVLAARIATLFALLIKENPNKWSDYTTKPSPDGTQSWADFDLEPGLVKRISASDDIVQVKPEHPKNDLSASLESLTRYAGVEFDLPLEVAMLNFREVNYSAARAALIVAGRAAEAQHYSFSQKGLSRVYRWRVSKWIKNGELDRPSGEDENNFWKHRVVRHPQKYLDPVKEVEGELAAIDGGIKLLEESLMERGWTIDEYVNARARELDMIKAANVTIGRSKKTRDDLPTEESERAAEEGRQAAEEAIEESTDE